jgi:hypothetical protein
VPRRVLSAVLVALASPAILSGSPSAAQPPLNLAWTSCALFEDLPGGGRLLFQSDVGPGWAPKPFAGWVSGPGGSPTLNLYFGEGPVSAPTSGRAVYHFSSEPQLATDYKFVFIFDGAAPPATLSLGTGFGSANPGMVGTFNVRDNPQLMASFAKAQRVTATVFEGDRQIAQRTLELAPDRRVAGLDAFVRRVKANDPLLCHSASGPRLPVPTRVHGGVR